MGWNKVYILIMGSIRSFDGRNCEWLIKYPRAVGISSISSFRGYPVASVYYIHPRGVRFAWFANPWPHRGHLVGSLNTPARCLVRMVRIPWPHRGHT